MTLDHCNCGHPVADHAERDHQGFRWCPGDCGCAYPEPCSEITLTHLSMGWCDRASIELPWLAGGAA